jgi:uncharacterized protein (TIGR02265 family)
MQQPPTEKLVFEQIVEGLYVRALSKKMTLRCLERLKEAGINLNKPLLPAYPAETWFRAQVIAAEELFPGDSLNLAIRKLGEQMVEGYRETLLGHAVQALLKVVGPKTTLQKAARNFRSGNNYTETKLTELGPTSYELWINETGPNPHFDQGIIIAGLRAAGVPEPLVEVGDFDGHACTYRVSWR